MSFVIELYPNFSLFQENDFFEIWTLAATLKLFVHWIQAKLASVMESQYAC